MAARRALEITATRSRSVPTQTGYNTDLIEEAAALWESLSQNHPLIDGNKRTAFAATYTFSPSMAGASRRTRVAALYEANQFTFDKLVPWLRDHVALEPSKTWPYCAP